MPSVSQRSPQVFRYSGVSFQAWAWSVPVKASAQTTPFKPCVIGGGRFALGQVNLRTDRGILGVPSSATFAQEIADRLGDGAAILDLVEHFRYQVRLGGQGHSFASAQVTQMAANPLRKKVRAHPPEIPEETRGDRPVIDHLAHDGGQVRQRIVATAPLEFVSEFRRPGLGAEFKLSA